MQPMVYLAGPISGLSYDGATAWREVAEKRLAAAGIQGLSPMRGKGYLTGESALASDCDSYAKFSSLSSNRGITTRDRFDCQRADVILVNLIGAERISIGTMIELGWADSARVPIILAMEPGNPHHHGIVSELAGFTVRTLDEAIDVAIHVLGQPQIQNVLHVHVPEGTDIDRLRRAATQMSFYVGPTSNFIDPSDVT